MAVPYSRRNFNNYDGIVTIYAIVAKYGNKTSAYVPTASFACKNLENYECHDKLGIHLTPIHKNEFMFDQVLK